MLSKDLTNRISRQLGIQTIGDLERAAGVDDRHAFWNGILAEIREQAGAGDSADYGRAFEAGRQALYARVLERHPEQQPARGRRERRAA